MLLLAERSFNQIVAFPVHGGVAEGLGTRLGARCWHDLGRFQLRDSTQDEHRHKAAEQSSDQVRYQLDSRKEVDLSPRAKKKYNHELGRGAGDGREDPKDA